MEIGKNAGVTILTPDKTDFKTKAITRDKEGPSNSTSDYLSKEAQSTNSKRYMHLYAHCNIIYNSQDGDATYVSIN